MKAADNFSAEVTDFKPSNAINSAKKTKNNAAFYVYNQA